MNGPVIEDASSAANTSEFGPVRKAILQRWLSWSCLAWSFVVLFFYYKKSPHLIQYYANFIKDYSAFNLWQPYMLKAVASVGLAGWIGWVTLQCGKFILLNVFAVPDLTVLETTVFAAPVGFGCISLLTFALGAIQFWYVPVFWTVLIFMTVIFFPRKWPSVNWYSSLEGIGPAEWWRYVALLLLVVIGLICVSGELMPEIFYDGLHYHLGVPSLYLLNHGIYRIPNFVIDGFILTVQMFWGFALTIGNELTVKLLNGAMAILLFTAFVAFERRYLARGAGLLASLLFFSMPTVGYILKTSGIDVVWTALQFIAVFSLARTLEKEHESSSRSRWLRLSGTLTGLAASCRYNAFAAIPIGALIIACGGKRTQSRRNALRQAAVFTLYASLVVAPYLIRNTIFHRNPVYPFASTIVGQPQLTAESWHNLFGEQHPRHVLQELSVRQSAIEFVFHPWFVTMPGYFLDAYIGPLLLGLLPLILFFRIESSAHAVLMRYAICLWLFWLFTTSSLRYSMSALAIFSLIAAHALLRQTQQQSVRRLLVAFCLVGAAWNCYYNLTLTVFSEGWRVLGGMMSESAYLREGHTTYPNPPYEALEWMNANLPKESKVMMAGERRGYYAHMAIVPSSTYYVEPIVEVARRAKDGTQMSQLLKKEGVTHLFFNVGEAQRMAKGGYASTFFWDDHSWRVLEDFWAHYVRLVWGAIRENPQNSKALFVYEFHPEANPSRPEFPAPPNPFEPWRPTTFSTTGKN